jgi:dephospho-CoA kinase
MNVDVAIGICGRIGSGKTTLAAELASRLDCTRASFGDYVRFVAEDRGLDATRREVLQNLGDELIRDGWRPFCEAVLQHAHYAGGSIVLDGIRHGRAVSTITELLSPLPLRLVAIEATDALRATRLIERGVDQEAVERVDIHPNEAEVLDVIASADVVISSDANLNDAVAIVLGILPNASPSSAS